MMSLCGACGIGFDRYEVDMSDSLILLDVQHVLSSVVQCMLSMRVVVLRSTAQISNALCHMSVSVSVIECEEAPRCLSITSVTPMRDDIQVTIALRGEYSNFASHVSRSNLQNPADGEPWLS